MKVYGQIERAQLENKASDHSATPIGMIWWNTATGTAKVSDGTLVRSLLRNDAKAVLGNSATASQNIRLHRGAASVLQFVTGDDVTAEGSLSTSLAQISKRIENYANAAALPAFGNAGRLAWQVDTGDMRLDVGASWKYFYLTTDTTTVLTTTGTQVITNKDIDGGTAADTRRITVPKDTKANLDILSRKAGTIVYGTDTQKFYYDNGSLLKDVASGSSSGINYISANPDAEVDTTGWATYADAAGSVPVDGTGGVATTTWTRSTSSPLRGLANFLMTKDAANRQGEGVGYAFTIDAADVNKNLRINFDLSASSAFVAGDSSDVRVFVYDVTNATLIYPVKQTIIAANGTFQTTFQATNSTSYRLILHIATTNASAWTLKVDNVQVGPQDIVYGPAMTDWQAYTPVFTGMGTVTNISFFSRRVGDSLEIEGSATLGTVAASLASMSLPGVLVLDTTKISLVNTTANPGMLVGHYSDNAANSFGAIVTATGTSSLLLYFGGGIGGGVPLTPQNGSSVATSSTVFTLKIKVPIAGWSTNVAAANSGTTRIADVLANGTRVTGAAPTALGQYRSYLRNVSASTYTETNGSPTTAPSSANGILLYASTAWGTVNPNNSPTKYDIFVGKGKTVAFQFYSGTGRTGQISVDYYIHNNNTSVGFVTEYDPTTGVATVVAPSSTISTSTPCAGLDANGALVTSNIYCDIIVSDNALSVQQETSKSIVSLSGSSGYGVVNTKIKIFSTVVTNTGTAITYATSANNGDSFTINETGVYSVVYTDYSTGGSRVMGLSRSSSQLTTSIASITDADQLSQILTVISATGTAQWTGRLNVGDVVRAHNDGNSMNATSGCRFTIVKVGP